MSELKVQHFLTLAHLISKGAKSNFVSITTSSLGRNIKKSQQSASKHLLELEESGFVERMISGRNISVRVTPKGYSEMLGLYSALKSCLESSSKIELKGSIVSGMGEGAYYMSLKGYTEQFKEKIGYVPFPGTLNIRLDRKEDFEAVKKFDNAKTTYIEGFSDGKRTYGWVKCHPAKLNSSLDCLLIRLERTHHDTSIVELISKYDLRKAAKLDDGTKVRIEIPLKNNS